MRKEGEQEDEERREDGMEEEEVGRIFTPFSIKGYPRLHDFPVILMIVPTSQSCANQRMTSPLRNSILTQSHFLREAIVGDVLQ